jgi:hypothetical protein
MKLEDIDVDKSKHVLELRLLKYLLVSLEARQ